jgi:hypothetical protein
MRDIAAELAVHFQPDKRAKFKPGDRVKLSEHALESSRNYWLERVDARQKSAAKGWLDKKVAARGTVVAAGTNGHAIGAVVKWDDGTVSETIEYLLMPADKLRYNGLE